MQLLYARAIGQSTKYDKPTWEEQLQSFLRARRVICVDKMARPLARTSRSFLLSPGHYTRHSAIFKYVSRTDTLRYFMSDIVCHNLYRIDTLVLGRAVLDSHRCIVALQ